ncbi:uncharacterized protein LOC143899728 isoform X2 [Temnothorax americanus]|uniref:uncharacterized protein LOC143899728 isoform X2 n=1 Tax=Temnothorax americanus TaxID=1964332 RepID=UPI0040684715
MESKEMKNVMKEFEDKLKVMTESYEEKLKEAERKSKEEMEEKLKEMNNLIKYTRAEYDGLVEYGNQTKNFMREKLDEVKMKDTRTSSLPNMPGRSTTKESESGRTQASGSAMVTTTKSVLIATSLDIWDVTVQDKGRTSKCVMNADSSWHIELLNVQRGWQIQKKKGTKIKIILLAHLTL